MSRTSLNLAAAILMVLTATAAGAQECPPAVLQRLTDAGYNAVEAKKVCAVTSAIGANGLMLQVRGALVDDVANTLAQTLSQVPEANVVLPAVRKAVYCGASDRHTGRLLVAAAKESFALSRADCSASLKAVARRIGVAAAGDGAAIVASLKVEWRPWRLALTVAGAAGADRNGNEPFLIQLLVLAALQVRHEVNMKDLLIPIGLDDSELRAAAVAYFDNDALTLAFGLVEFPVSVDVSQVPSLAGLVGTQLQGAPGNASLYVSHGAINTFARDVFARSPFGIGTTMILGNIEVHELDVRGAPGLYAIRGRVTDRENDVYRASVKLSGDDLVLDTLLIESESRTCVDAQVDPVEARRCLDENIVLADIATEATRSGTVILSERNGRAWAHYVEDREFPLPIGDIEQKLKGDVERTAADELGLFLHFRFAIAPGT